VTTEISLYVLRPRQDLELGLPPDSPVAWDEHKQRAEALHELLDDNPEWSVLDWGDTDDSERTHESVTMLLHSAAQAAPVLEAVAGAVALKIGNVVMTAAVEAAIVDPIKRLIGRLSEKQNEGEISVFNVGLAGGSTIQVLPAEGSTVRIQATENGKLGASVTIEIDRIAT
jgi:hypothetical protein